ncbi:hypothetical protein [Corynebacterium sp.]|uniref:hypothetical protein n=1 Tax=Corynebacterium sp. TaxID=1720 RepID=UPI001987F0F2|nr:hypothetical protein [Corynebacterium sp.]HHU68447.1 hypothetical protein [Corynebacterium sp.]
MSNQHDGDGIRGGFNRPEFSPGTVLPGSQVRPEIAALDGARIEQTAAEEQQRQESLAANRRRRMYLSVAIGTAVLLVALIVFGMIWFWADERWAATAALL